MTPNRPASGKLATGTHLYRLQLAGGMRVWLDQRDADFAVEVLDSSHTLERTVDSFEYASESVSLRDTGTRTVWLRIRRKAGESFPAPYSLKLAVLGAPSNEEKTLREAEDLCTQARRLRAEATADSLQKAAESWRGAVRLWREARQTSAFLRSSVALADTLHALRDYGEARRIYGEALELARSEGDRRSAAECLNNRGLGFWETGSYPEAAADLKLALAEWRALPLQSGLGASLTNQGLLRWQLGAYQEALESYLAALRVFAPCGNRRGQAYVLNNLALTYGALGDYPRALEFFERASAVFEQERDMLAAGRPLVNSARVCLRMNAPARAARNLARGFPMAERSGDRRALAEAWNLMGEVSAYNRQAGKAREEHTRALELFREVGDRRGEANAVTNLGLAALEAGDTAGAIRLLTDAAGLHHRLGTPASEGSVLYHLARAQRDAGSLDQARRNVDAAIAVGERLRGGVAAENLRVSYLASIHDFYRLSIDVLMRLSEQRHDDSLVAEAWRVAERSRARSLVEAIGSARRATRDSGKTELLDRRRRALERINSELVQLTRVGSEESRKRLEGLLTQVEEIDSQLGTADEGYRWVATGLSPSLPEVQSELLDDDTVLLEYSLGEQASYLWVVDRSSITPYRLPAGRKLTSDARFLSQFMNAGGPQARAADLDPAYRRVSRALAAALIEPAAARLRARRLLIVPDGALHAVPFAALLLPGGVPLVEKFEVLTLPSASTLAALRSRQRSRPAASKQVAVIADPVFDSSDARVVRRAASAPGSARYARLPFSGAEARSVAALWPASSVKLLLGFQASLDALVSGGLRDCGTVHISTHSTADFLDPERSNMVFSLVAEDGSARPGVLPLERIYGLDLNARLLVLSACQTALGKPVGGEGSLSLSRAFLFAGADRVVASLWRVDDEATSELLARFYKNMLKTPSQPPAAALRNAQLAIRRQVRWRAPFYWAGWVLQGEP